jgi:NAD+ diphosphatase
LALDIFSLVTGYLENGESPQEAVIREVSEELGLTGNIKRHIGNYVLKRRIR